MKLAMKRQRSGVTLVEVLVAMFIMAVGLLTLLALFPLGVLTMDQAIRDDRAASAATNATAIATVQNLRLDSALYSPPNTDYFKNPDPANAKAFVNAPANGPSYPIYVDPIGANSYIGPWNNWVGGQTDGGVPRFSPSYYVPPGQTQTMVTLQWFSLLDDLQFESDLVSYGNLPWQGKARQFGPAPPSRAAACQRDIITSWAYLLRRPLQADPTVVEMSVIVYNKRAMALTTSRSGAFLQGDETAFPATFNPGGTANTIVTLTGSAQNIPNVRVGGWILDATPTPTAGPPYTGLHASFYRVVGVTDTGPGVMDVEVQTPFVGWPATSASSGVVVVMDGVSNVFNKGTGWRHTAPGP